MARIYLVRHAMHDLVGRVLAGRLPGVPLSAEGRAQADRLVESLVGQEIAAILSSPLDRCRQTAAPIAERLGLPVREADALNEIDCGDWTGMRFDALADDPRWHAWNTERGLAAIPGGESIAAVQSRVMALLARIEAEDGPPTVLVTHSDVVKVVVLTLLQAPLDLHDRLEIDPASITVADLWRGGGKVVRLNQAAA